MTLGIFTLLIGTAPALLAAEPAALPEGAVVEDWPHFLGPHLNATTREGPLLEKWPATGPAIVWEAERGEGYSCPVITGGRLFHLGISNEATANNASLHLSMLLEVVDVTKKALSTVFTIDSAFAITPCFVRVSLPVCSMC